MNEQVEDAITREIAAHYDYHPRMLAVHLLDSPAMRDLLAEAKADAWDEAVQAVAWAMDHGSWPDAGAYARDHNPYRALAPTPPAEEANQ